MKPLYDAHGVTIYHGEALAGLQMLPDGEAAAIITDPPYSSGGFTRGDRTQDPEAKYVHTGTEIIRASFAGDNRDARSWCYWCALWLSECLRVVRESGYALMFCDWRQLPLASDSLQAGGFVWRGIVPWDKTEGARAPHTGYFRHQAEFVVWGTRGVSLPAKHGGPWPGAYRFVVKQTDKFHMTGKPTELMRRLVQVAEPGGLIVDPFGGSGTTAVAALLEGRRCIMIEREAANCEIAIDRLERAAKQGTFEYSPAAEPEPAALELGGVA